MNINSNDKCKARKNVNNYKVLKHEVHCEDADLPRNVPPDFPRIINVHYEKAIFH